MGQPGRYYKIRVIDEKSGRGVPLVELRTTNSLSYYTDNNGIIAFFEPGLMNIEVYFYINSHGYEYPADGFGYRGKVLKTTPGDSTIIQLKRINLAERLYRITGEGLYSASILTGSQVPVKQPVLNGKVMGQDTFIETVYNGKMYWFWGDTDRPSYPLGNFSTSGATSEIPGNGGLDPSAGVDLTYFVDESGFSKKMCLVPGPGAVWLHWLATLKDSQGRISMVTSYTRVKTLGEAYEQGLARFNDTSEVFEPIFRFELNSPFFPDGQSHRVNVHGKEYIYFDMCGRYPLRVLADLNHIQDLSSYEAFTCLQDGAKFDSASTRLDRGTNGNLIYGWKANTEPLSAGKEKYLIGKGLMTPEERWSVLYDFQSGDAVIPASGSIFWNEYRKKWVMVFQQMDGTSRMGEVWYAEGDTPTGPWVYTRKIVTHDNYTFYNVGQHPLFDQNKGRVIYFEGTYTNFFSGNPVMTPRYNYNQIMYRLDLGETELSLPVPVYKILDRKTKIKYQLRKGIDSLDYRSALLEIPFMAIPPNRFFEGLVPIYEVREKGKLRLKTIFPESRRKMVEPLFYGLPDKNPASPEKIGLNGQPDWISRLFLSPLLVPLYEFKDQHGLYTYSVKSDQKGLIRSEKPVCRVWINPRTMLNFDFEAQPIPIGN